MWGVGEERASNNQWVTTPSSQNDCIGGGSKPRPTVFPTPYPLHPYTLFVTHRRGAEVTES
ncbi:DNA primase [Nodularia spumigena CCY9414]|nr:DNA primase [Nodularia spumigena CCY9414]